MYFSCFSDFDKDNVLYRMSPKNYFFSDCRINLNREGITVYSGQPVTLKCSWDYKGRLFWIRLVPGKLPVVLGKTFGSKTADHRIRITEETQASFLRIWRTITSDTGYYYCMIYYHELTFAKEIHLSVEGKSNEY